MNWFDVIVIILVVTGAFSGMTKGLIRQLLSIIGLVGGIILAGQRYQALGPQLPFVTDPKIAEIAAFVLIFLGSVIAANLLGTILQRTSKLLMFGFMDRMAGLAFGALEATVIIQLALLLMLKFSLLSQFTFVQESTTGVILMRYIPILLGLLPSNFNDLLKLLSGM